jgi:proteasome lid subunit RPN8/RPN11
MIATVCRVVVDTKAEAGYRRRALRRLPNEYLETLWGYVRGTTAYVCVFMPLEHKARPQSLEYNDCDWEHDADEAREHNLHLIGSIHSHPRREDTVFSETDARGVFDTSEIIMGICSIENPTKANGLTRRKCRVDYYPCPRPLDVKYSNWGTGK